VVIEAWQIKETDFTADYPNADHVPGVIYSAPNGPNRPDKWHVKIKTPGDLDMVGYVGDWIIREAEGEIYPCPDDVFRVAYDPISSRLCREHFYRHRRLTWI
jgi:hypothetical protein